MVHTPAEYQVFLATYFKPLCDLLRSVPPQSADTPEHTLRKQVLDILTRLPPNEVIRTCVGELYEVCLNVLQTDNQENGVPAIKLMLDLQKAFRVVLEQQGAQLAQLLTKVSLYPCAGLGVRAGWQSGAPPERTEQQDCCCSCSSCCNRCSILCAGRAALRRAAPCSALSLRQSGLIGAAWTCKELYADARGLGGKSWALLDEAVSDQCLVPWGTGPPWHGRYYCGLATAAMPVFHTSSGALP